MRVIKGEKITQKASLSANQELHFSQESAPSIVWEKKCQEMFQKGQEEGEKIGYDKGVIENRSLIELIQTIDKQLVNQTQALLDTLKPEIIELVMNICRKIIFKELNDPTTMIHLIHSLLDNVISHSFQHRLCVVVTPEDLAMLENHLSKIEYDVREVGNIYFRAAPNMTRGECRIESESNVLNYMIERELIHLQNALLAPIESSSL